MVRRCDAEDIPVVILAGGFGMRLREETERLPKPLVPIGERPMLWHIMRIYAHHGFRRFVIPLGYKGWEIKEYFLRYREHEADLRIDLATGGVGFSGQSSGEDWEVTLVETGLHAGTGARLARVARYLDEETFCLTYGDGVGDIDLTAELAFHHDEGRLGTVCGVHPTSRYGEMRVEGAEVTEFNEKPTKPEGFVSGGFFVLQRGVLDYLTDEEDLFFEDEPLRKLARDGQLSVYEHDGFWVGMDTYRDFVHLNEMWKDGSAPWKVWED